MVAVRVGVGVGRVGGVEMRDVRFAVIVAVVVRGGRGANDGR